MTEPGVQRIEALLDPGTFVELDQVAGAPGDEAVVGQGTVDGRDVAVYGLDPATLGEVAAAKIVKAQELALRCRVPIVGLLGPPGPGSPRNRGAPPASGSPGVRISWGGGLGPDGIPALAGRAEILLRQVRSSGVVPQLSVICQEPAPEDLHWAALTDFVVRAADDAGRRGEMRALLSHLPAHRAEAPPYAPSTDPSDRGDPELQTLVPEQVDEPYDMREVITRLLDDRRFLEVQADVAPSMLVGFGRLGGYAAGVVANQPSVRSGAIDGDAAAKAARFIRTCDAFGVPLVTLVDAPADLAGCTARDRAKLSYAYGEASVPKLTVVTRRAAGEAYLLMSPRQMGVDLSVAWPTAEIGAAGPYAAAERGYVDDVIEPRETRRTLVRGLELCRHRAVDRPPAGHGNVPL